MSHENAEQIKKEGLQISYPKLKSKVEFKLESELNEELLTEINHKFSDNQDKSKSEDKFNYQSNNL